MKNNFWTEISKNGHCGPPAPQAVLKAASQATPQVTFKFLHALDQKCRKYHIVNSTIQYFMEIIK